MVFIAAEPHIYRFIIYSNLEGGKNVVKLFFVVVAFKNVLADESFVFFLF